MPTEDGSSHSGAERSFHHPRAFEHIAADRSRVILDIGSSSRSSRLDDILRHHAAGFEILRVDSQSFFGVVGLHCREFLVGVEEAALTHRH